MKTQQRIAYIHNDENNEIIEEHKNNSIMEVKL